MNKSKVLLFYLLFSSINYFSFSQEKKNNLIDEFDKYFLQAKVAYNNNDYFRAKNLFDYCSKMPHPRSKLALKEKDICVSLWIEKATLDRKIKEGDTFEAQKILNGIVLKNPNDKIASKLLIALNNSEYANENLKKQKEKSNIAQNLSNKPSSSSVNRPQSTKPKIVSIKKESKLTTVATFLPSNINSIANEFAEVERARIAKVEKEKKEFIDSYTIAVNNLKNCNYKESLFFFTKAYKLKPNASKTKRFYNMLLVLESKNSLLKELLINPKINFEYISSVYEQIIKINRDLEAIQSASSCNGVSLEYAEYLKGQLPLNANEYNCDIVLKLTNKIETLSEAVYNESIVQGMVKDCALKSNPCNNTSFLLNQKLNTINASYNTGNYRQAQRAIEAFLIEIDSYKENCKDIDFSSIQVNGKILQKSIDLGIENVQCSENQKKNFELAIDFYDRNQLEASLIQLEKMDTTCIDNFFKKTVSRQKKVIEASINSQLFRTFEDSAKNSYISKQYSQAKSLYNTALAYSRSKSDSARIEKGYRLTDCLSKNKNSNKCIESRKVGKCDTISFRSIRLNFGLIGGSLKKEAFYPTLFLDQESIKASASSQFFIGITYLKTNYSKIIDHGVSFNYFSNQTIEFYRKNESNLFSFQSSSVALGYEQKYHKKDVCFNKPRIYGKLGILLNQNLISYEKGLNSSTYQIINSNYLNSISTTFSPGFGFEIPKRNVSLEFFAYRMALVKSPNTKIQEPWRSKFVNGGLGIKFSYGFTL